MSLSIFANDVMDIIVPPSKFVTMIGMRLKLQFVPVSSKWKAEGFCG